MKSRAIYVFTYVFMAVSAILSGLAVYWMLFDTAVPAIHSLVMIVDENGNKLTTVRRGEKIIVVRDSCVVDEGMAFYTRTLVSPKNDLVYFMPSGYQYLYKGCSRRFNEVVIPRYVEPGHYQYVVSVLFRNNPLVDTNLVLPIPEIDVAP